jgi:hypothetical protein
VTGHAQIDGPFGFELRPTGGRSAIRLRASVIHSVR